MENEKKGFIFLPSYYEAIKEIEESTQIKIYQAIMEYALNGVEIELTGVAKAIMALIKPTLENCLSKYNSCVENGKKGGRPKKQEQEQENPIKTQAKPNQNPTETQAKPKQNLEREKEKEIYIYNIKEREKRENENKTNISLTLSDIQLFKENFPNRKIDIDKAQTFAQGKQIDMNKLITSIQESNFLKTCNNMGLSSCLQKYEQIVGGAYKNFSKQQNQTNNEIKLAWGKTYKKESFNDLIDNLEDIEV